MIQFFVPGIPKPAGSKRGIPIYRGKRSGPQIFTGHVAMVDACESSKDWKWEVKNAAKQAHQGLPLECPIDAFFQFNFPRPKWHYGSGKNASIVKESAPKHHLSKPDVLKLSRAVEDALSGIVYKDDSQIVYEYLQKQYGDKPGVHITIQEHIQPQTEVVETREVTDEGRQMRAL